MTYDFVPETKNNNDQVDSINRLDFSCIKK